MKKTIGLLSAIALSSSAYADVNVGGFVDAGFQWTKDASPSSMWGFRDGAVHFTGNSGSTSYLVDLGYNTGNVWADQAAVSNKYDSGFNWTVGKVDRILGGEGNDSNTWMFSSQGHISSLWNGSSHTGLVLGYDLSDMMGLKVLVANGQNTGDFEYPEFGFRLDSKSDGMNFWLGGTFEGVGGESGYNFDLGATSKMGSMDLGLEVAMIKAAVADGESGLAFSVHGSTEVSETMGFGARVEWDNGKASGADTMTTQLDVTVGPSFQLSENSSAKLDYTLTKFSGDVGSLIDTQHSVGLAVVHNF